MTPYGFCMGYEWHENEGSKNICADCVYVNRSSAAPLNELKGQSS